MTEAPYSANRKVSDTQITVRAETFDEFQQKLQELDNLTVTSQGGSATVTAAQPVQQAVQNLQAAGLVAAPAAGSIEQREDQWGNNYTLGVPDAGTCHHGARIVKNATNQHGKRYKAFVCVNDSPFREGKYDKSNICEIAWPNR